MAPLSMPALLRTRKLYNLKLNEEPSKPTTMAHSHRAPPSVWESSKLHLDLKMSTSQSLKSYLYPTQVMISSSMDGTSQVQICTSQPSELVCLSLIYSVSLKMISNPLSL